MGRIVKRHGACQPLRTSPPGADDFVKAARFMSFRGGDGHWRLLRAFTLPASPRRLDWEFNFNPIGGRGAAYAARNRSILALQLDVRLEDTVWLDPDGDGPVRWVGEADRGKGAQDWTERFTACKGIVTGSADVFLCTLFSDDAVVLLYDTRGHAAGLTVIRAAQPSAQGVRDAISVMAAHVATQPREVIGAVSPCLGPCCFRWTGGVAEGAASVTNLWDFAQMAMVDAGMLPENITIPRLCTQCSGLRFFSRRVEGPATGAGAIVTGIRGGGRRAEGHDERRAQGAQTRQSAPLGEAPASAARLSLTGEERRLNRAMRCPYGHNKVYIRGVIQGASRAARQPVLALRCDIMAHVGQAAAGYNIVPKEYIEHFCCADYQQCPAYQEFSKRRRV